MLKQISGLFPQCHCSATQTSRFRVIQKSHQPNKWQLIVDLSYHILLGTVLLIPKVLCGLSYITVDDSCRCLIWATYAYSCVQNRHKMFLIPVHSADRHLLVMKWRNELYVDGCLPFGLHSAPKLFNILGRLGIMDCSTGRSIMHLLLSWFILIISPRHSLTCKQRLDIFMQLCDNLGILLAVERLRDYPLPSPFLVSPWTQPKWRLNSQKIISLEYRPKLNTGLQKEGYKEENSITSRLASACH